MDINLRQKKSAATLKVTIADNLTWDKHIQDILNKGDRTIGFIRRNLRECTVPMKAAYTAMVRPSLEYALTTVWDTPSQAHIKQLESVHTELPDTYTTTTKAEQNLTKSLIRKVKRSHFSASVTDNKDTKLLWQQIKSVQNSTHKSSKLLPDQLNIDGSVITDSHEIACKLNEFFTNISLRLNSTPKTAQMYDQSKLINYVNNKVPSDTFFKIPLITTSQVAEFIRKLDPGKSTGLDGAGPRILKMACDIISPSIAALINKSITSGSFPNQLKQALVYPIFKNGCKDDPSNYRPISILPNISKIFEKHVNSHLMGYLNKYKLIHE